VTRRRLVVATSNPGKLRELRELLADLPAEVVGLAGLPPVQLPPEGSEYESNAAEKARAVASQLGVLAVADDSGLEVEALCGAPGPHSARYGGPQLDDAGRWERLLQALSQVPAGARGARFVCVAALALPSGEVFTARGECEGRILVEPRGRGGFGYDPVFALPESERSLAELSADEKNRISHRARALRALRPQLLRALED